MDLGTAALFATPIHQDFSRPEKTHPRGHPLDGAAAGVQIGSSRQHHQAGTQTHQHMHPQPVGLGSGGGMGAVEAHGQAAKHGQTHAQQGFEIGGEVQGDHVPMVRPRGAGCQPLGRLLQSWPLPSCLLPSWPLPKVGRCPIERPTWG